MTPVLTGVCARAGRVLAEDDMTVSTSTALADHAHEVTLRALILLRNLVMAAHLLQFALLRGEEGIVGVSIEKIQLLARNARVDRLFLLRLRLFGFVSDARYITEGSEVFL